MMKKGTLALLRDDIDVEIIRWLTKELTAEWQPIGDTIDNMSDHARKAVEIIRNAGLVKFAIAGRCVRSSWGASLSVEGWAGGPYVDDRFLDRRAGELTGTEERWGFDWVKWRLTEAGVGVRKQILAAQRERGGAVSEILSVVRSQRVAPWVVFFRLREIASVFAASATATANASATNNVVVNVAPPPPPVVNVQINNKMPRVKPSRRRKAATAPEAPAPETPAKADGDAIHDAATQKRKRATKAETERLVNAAIAQKALKPWLTDEQVANIAGIPRKTLIENAMWKEATKNLGIAGGSGAFHRAARRGGKSLGPDSATRDD